jgi:hypothetical protein
MGYAATISMCRSRYRLQEMSYESDHRGLSLVGADDGDEAVGEERDDSCGASAY